jgi:hypothetical protein
MYWLAVAFVEHKQWKAADSVVQILAARRDDFTPVERELFASIDAFAHSDFAQDLVASRALFKRDSTVIAAGGIAGNALAVNRPREVLTVLGSLSPSRVGGAAFAYWKRMAIADHMLGDFQAEMAVATQGRARSSGPVVQAFLLDAQTRALVALGDMATLRQKVDSSIAAWSHGPRRELLARYNIPENPGETCERVARELFAHNRPADAMAYVNRGIAWHTAQPPADEAEDAVRHSLGLLLMHARLLDSARAVWTRLAVHDTLYVDARIQLAITAAWRGDTALAGRTMRTLDSLAKIQYAFGRPLVHEARIAAALGHRAEAVGLLERAMHEGAPFDWQWHADAEFQSLRDFVPFRTLIAPKG